MATDPGDLVLDPTCGSGTTAYVAEQWGRRWITIDTSRVALALARARLMGARYPFYFLSDSNEGKCKEAEIIGGIPSAKPVSKNIRHGFVYRRCAYITSGSIANNAGIDAINDKYQQKLEPLREKLNIALKQKYEEWEIPRETSEKWSAEAKKLHSEWWEVRITRQRLMHLSQQKQNTNSYTINLMRIIRKSELPDLLQLKVFPRTVCSLWMKTMN
jgi:adenine-specific DNA-methyltransferase